MASDMLHIDITLKDVTAIGCAIQMMQASSLNDKARVLTKIPCFSDLQIAMGCEQIFVDFVSEQARQIVVGEWGCEAYEAYFAGVQRGNLKLEEMWSDESSD